MNIVDMAHASDFPFALAVGLSAGQRDAGRVGGIEQRVDLRRRPKHVFATYMHELSVHVCDTLHVVPLIYRPSSGPILARPHQLESMVRYFGIEVNDALETAEQNVV